MKNGASSKGRRQQRLLKSLVAAASSHQVEVEALVIGNLRAMIRLVSRLEGEEFMLALLCSELHLHVALMTHRCD